MINELEALKQEITNLRAKNTQLIELLLRAKTHLALDELCPQWDLIDEIEAALKPGA